MATLRNRRNLAAVSRETPEGSKSSRGQSVLDPELTQDNISQVSEEIQGRVTKKLSKDLSKTESRILRALSKLDEFLLNPQVRTCSVAVQGTSRNANSENRETHGYRSSDDPYPEVGYFPHHSGQLNSPEAETNSHMVTETYPHSRFLKFISVCASSEFLLEISYHSELMQTWRGPSVLLTMKIACSSNSNATLVELRRQPADPKRRGIKKFKKGIYLPSKNICC